MDHTKDQAPEQIRIENLTKIFGHNEKKALALGAGGKIIGIEPGQGINRLAEEAIRRYRLE